MASLIARIQTVLARYRFARFLLIGGVNTLFGIGLFWLALAIIPNTFSALLVSSVIAIFFNFMTTGSYVFKSRDPRLLVAFFGVYVVVFAYNALGLDLLAAVSIGPRMGGLLILPGAIAISYGLNRSYVFRQAVNRN